MTDLRMYVAGARKGRGIRETGNVQAQGQCAGGGGRCMNPLSLFSPCHAG